MTHENEREISAAMLATTKCTLALLQSRTVTARGEHGTLTERHRALLTDASTCFRMASELLASMAEQST
jgi:hypothetical protein